MLGYALGFKVQTVFITDGLSWHCYSNLHKGNTEAVTFTLTEHDLLPACLQLIQWLDAAQSGHGIALPATAVSTAAAVAPVVSTTLKKPASKPIKAAVESAEFVELTHINLLQLRPDQKPKQLRLPDGSVVPLKTWKDILQKVCAFVLAQNPAIMLPCPDKAGKKTVLLSSQKPPTGISSSEFNYQGKQVFLYTNYSASSCVANALYLLKLAPPSMHQTPLAVTF